MTFAEKWLMRRQNHLCGRCGAELPKDYAKRTCAGCLEDVSDSIRVAYWRERGLPVPPHRRDRFDAKLRTVVTLTGMSGDEQAKVLGVSRDRVYKLRAEARARGYRPPRLATRHRGESSKWAALDALMAKPCDRCGLRGDHDCLPLHPDGSARRGPGRTYPDVG